MLQIYGAKPEDSSDESIFSDDNENHLLYDS